MLYRGEHLLVSLYDVADILSISIFLLVFQGQLHLLKLIIDVPSLLIELSLQLQLYAAKSILLNIQVLLHLYIFLSIQIEGSPQRFELVTWSVKKLLLKLIF